MIKTISFLFLSQVAIQIHLVSMPDTKHSDYVVVYNTADKLPIFLNNDTVVAIGTITGCACAGYAILFFSKMAIRDYRRKKLEDLTEKCVKKCFKTIIEKTMIEYDNASINNLFSKMLQKVKSKVVSKYCTLGKPTIKELEKNLLNKFIKPELKRALIRSDLKVKIKLNILNQFESCLKNSKAEFKVFN